MVSTCMFNTIYSKNNLFKSRCEMYTHMSKTLFGIKYLNCKLILFDVTKLQQCSHMTYARRGVILELVLYIFLNAVIN